MLIAFFIPGFWSSGIKNVCKYSIDEKPVVRINDHLQGIWKLAEDSDVHNYFIIEKDGDFAYSITYMNKSGNNRAIEHEPCSWSEIGNVKFISMPSWDDDYPGYVLMKIDEIGVTSWDITASMVTNPSIQKVTSREDLRMLLLQNVNNPAFYGKKLHLRKKFEFNSSH